MSIFDSKEKQLSQLIDGLCKMKPADVVGICYMMKVPLIRQDKTINSAENMICELGEKFCQLNWFERYKLLNLVKNSGLRQAEEKQESNEVK